MKEATARHENGEERASGYPFLGGLKNSDSEAKKVKCESQQRINRNNENHSMHFKQCAMIKDKEELRAWIGNYCFAAEVAAPLGSGGHFYASTYTYTPNLTKHYTIVLFYT